MEAARRRNHTNETPQLTSLLQQFGASLAAFVRDMGDRIEDIVLVTMSEFGRTVKEDGNASTDHGHVNVMMVLGGPVRGVKSTGAGRVWSPSSFSKDETWRSRRTSAMCLANWSATTSVRRSIGFSRATSQANRSGC